MNEIEPNTINFVKIFEETRVRNVMNTQASIAVLEDDPLSKAQVQFTDRKVSHLLVVTRENKLVGLISPKYIYKAVAPTKIRENQVIDDPNYIIDGESFYAKDTLDMYILRQIMYKDPFTLDQDDLLATALLIMARKRISCVPIVDDNREVKGILTNQEVMNFITSLIEGIFLDKKNKNN